MVPKKSRSIKIDLTHFKLHLSCRPDIELTLHFNTPSRKFYLSVIALVIKEMKDKGRMTSIILENHLDELVLLNKTIGKAAGSSKREHLLPRIYRKWKDALPDLENAPLFKVVGRKKRYDDSPDKVYLFSDEEKDCWANLFDYMGSNENVRLKFSIDKLSLNLKDVVIVYGESPESSEDAWERFVIHLKQSLEEQSDADSVNTRNVTPESKQKQEDQKNPAPGKPKQLIQSVMIGLIVILAGFIFWQYNKSVSTVEVAPTEKKTLPEKPSIAVLAFDNMSSDKEQEYFCDGLSEEIIVSLSSVPELFVVARNSSFSYKGKPVKVQQVSEELGVQYILEGSVRKSGENLRISAQLINALNGNHLWAENYDRKEENAIVLQEEIAMKVITELQVKLTGRKNIRLRAPCSQNPKAYLIYLKALGHAQRFTKEDNFAARRLAEQAIVLDPDYSCAYALLGGLYWYSVAIGMSPSPKESLISAIQMVNKAIELKPSYAGPHALLARIRTNMRQYGQALTEAEKALALDPNSEMAIFSMGYVLFHIGKSKEAIPFIKKKIRLDPFSTPSLYILGAAYSLNGQYEKAIQTCKKVLIQNPKFLGAWRVLAISYSEIGQMEEAKAAASTILKIDPEFSLEKYSKRLIFKRQADKDHAVNNLRKAGLPWN